MQLSRSAKLGLWTFLVLDLALAVLFVTFYVLRAERQQTSDLREIGASIYPNAAPLRDFELVDQDGRVFTGDRLLGRWSLLFFGFTSCPDICPLTMAELDQFYGALGTDGASELPQIVLVSLDPARDSAQVMADYLRSFNEEFIGLTGDINQLLSLAEQLYVVFSDAGDHAEAHQQAPNQEYVIDHSAHISVVNPEGELYAVMRPPHRDRDLVEAYRILIDQ